MSDTDHTRPNRREIMAELAEVKRSRDALRRNERLAMADARGFLPDEVALTCPQEAISILATQRNEATARAGREFNRAELMEREFVKADTGRLAAEKRAEEEKGSSAWAHDMWGKACDRVVLLADALRETQKKLPRGWANWPEEKLTRAVAEVVTIVRAALSTASPEPQRSE